MSLNSASLQPEAQAPSHPISETQTEAEEDEIAFDQYPEGGTAAWCAVLGGALVQFCTLGYMSSFGAYQAFYTLHYLTNESASAISWIGSMNAFLVSAVGLVSGMLYDRGYFYHLLIFGSLLQLFTLFMLSLAQPGQYYQIFLAQGIGLGTAQGILYVPITAIASHYFRRRRTLAMSLVTSGSSLGSVVHPIMLNYLFNGRVGFANGVRISATFVGVLLLIACLLIRTRLEPPKHPANYMSVWKGIIHDLPFCIMSLGLLIFQIALCFPLFYLQLDSVQHGNSEVFSFYSLVILNGSGLIGRLSTGVIAPRFGVPRLIIISTTLCGILILGMIGLDGIPSVVVLGTLYGYFAGVYIALSVTLVALLTKDHSELGARLGIGLTAASTGNLISGPISGALLTSQYQWWQPSLFNGFAALVGSALLMVMQRIRLRECSSEKQAEKA